MQCPITARRSITLSVSLHRFGGSTRFCLLRKHFKCFLVEHQVCGGEILLQVQ
jgi:hypothetical protein